MGPNSQTRKRVKSFCPAHVTLLFTICDADPNPLKKGSRGIGFSIKTGTNTEVKFEEGSVNEVEILINERADPAPVSRYVVDTFLRKTEHHGKVLVHHGNVHEEKSGFGLSGAGALSAALALNEILECGLTRIECGQIAHEAEVINRTGLGDVIGQFYGGFEMRVKEGAPGIGQIKKIELPVDTRIVCTSVGTLETRQILTNPQSRQKIITSGKEILEKLEQKSPMTLKQVFQNAKEFAGQTGLLPQELDRVLRKLEQNGFENASMIMLGKSICCFTDRDSIARVEEIIQSCFKKRLFFSETQIDEKGARLIS